MQDGIVNNILHQNGRKKNTTTYADISRLLPWDIAEFHRAFFLHLP